MALDASIPLQARGIQVDDPSNSLMKALQLQNASSQNAVHQLALQQAQENQQRQNRLREILLGGGGEDQLLREGFINEAGNLGKQRRENAKTDAETQSKQLEMARKRLDYGVQAGSALLQSQTPLSRQMVLQALTPGVQAGVIDMDFATKFVNGLPQDDAGIRAKLDEGMRGSIDAAKRIDQALAQQQFGETQRHNRTSEQTAQGQLGVAQGNLGVARDRLAWERENPVLTPVETANGPVLAATRGQRAGQTVPITQNGVQVPAKQPESFKKEAAGIQSQMDIIDSAIGQVKKTPSAFGAARGAATMAGNIPEAVAQRMSSDDEQVARSQVFNIVSKIINERAGAAQSAQELARLRGFLPGDLDDARTITNKLNGFKAYLKEQSKAYQPKQPAQSGPAVGAVEDGHRFKGGNPADPANWEKI